jgi:uncharacterized membrane protein YgcG
MVRYRQGFRSLPGFAEGHILPKSKRKRVQKRGCLFSTASYYYGVLGSRRAVFAVMTSLLSSSCLSLVPSKTFPKHAADQPPEGWLGIAWILQEAFVAKNLYVGNLPYTISQDDLHSLFEAHGSVQSAQIIMDRDTGRSKGFAFVEMGSDQEAQAAIAALNGKEVSGRALTVNEARPREERSSSRGFGGGGGSRGQGGYGGGGGGRRY